jgi:hypothetical protein
VKRHSADEGNDRVDELVQWGKSDGPFTRLGRGISEGSCLTGPVADGQVRNTAEQSPGEAIDEADNDDERVRELLADLPVDFWIGMKRRMTGCPRTAECGTPRKIVDRVIATLYSACRRRRRMRGRKTEASKTPALRRKVEKKFQR